MRLDLTLASYFCANVCRWTVSQCRWLRVDGGGATQVALLLLLSLLDLFEFSLLGDAQFALPLLFRVGGATFAFDLFGLSTAEA